LLVYDFCVQYLTSLQDIRLIIAKAQVEQALQIEINMLVKKTENEKWTRCAAVIAEMGGDKYIPTAIEKKFNAMKKNGDFDTISAGLASGSISVASSKIGPSGNDGSPAGNAVQHESGNVKVEHGEIGEAQAEVKAEVENEEMQVHDEV
jgi:hypothetical protein